MKAATRSPAIRRATEKARALGFRVEFAPFLESARAPGLLGQIAGLCDHESKVIRVRTMRTTKEQMAAIIEHEIEHAEGAERGADRPDLGLRCGGTR